MKTPALNVTLKNVKYAAFASQETACYSATVYIDGKACLQAHNEGHGGQTWLDELPGAVGSFKRLQDYAASLPPIVTDLPGKNPNEKFTYQPRADTLVDELLEQYLAARDLKRALKSKTVFARGGKVWKLSVVWSDEKAAAIRAHIEKKYPGAVILNGLREAEALKLWKGESAQ